MRCEIFGVAVVSQKGDRVSLESAAFKLAMLHKVVPQAGSILKRQRILGSIQLKVEAIRTSGIHGSYTRAAIDASMVCIDIALHCDWSTLQAPCRGTELFENECTCADKKVADSKTLRAHWLPALTQDCRAAVCIKLSAWHHTQNPGSKSQGSCAQAGICERSIQLVIRHGGHGTTS